MTESTDSTQGKQGKREQEAADAAAVENAKSVTAVRWYLMIYPYGRKALSAGIEREIERRRKAGETPIDYFAPVCVEAKEVDGRIVTTDRHLFENYLFVHASIREIFRMKRYEEQYNLPRREYDGRGRQYYPSISDEAIRTLRWIARSYSGVIPVYAGDDAWLVKGDRIRITAGPFKGMEATLFENRRNSRREVMAVIDNWMTVPLLHVGEKQYRVVAMNGGDAGREMKIDDGLLPRLHGLLCRSYTEKINGEEREFVSEVAAQYGRCEVRSDVMRCKLYAVLLTAYTIIGDTDRRDRLAGFIRTLLPSVTAEQSKALLLTTLYGCTDDSLCHSQAHRIIDPWRSGKSPKKSKRQLIDRLDDYDRCLGHNQTAHGHIRL